VIIISNLGYLNDLKMSANSKKISEIHHRAERFSGTSGFGIVTYRKGGRHGPRLQTNHQLVVVHRGQVMVKIDGVPLDLHPGMGLLLAPGHWEEFQFSRQTETRHSWCQLLPGDLPVSMTFPASATHQPSKCPAVTIALIKLGLSTRADPSQPRPTVSLVIATMWTFAASLQDRLPKNFPALRTPALGRFQNALESLGSEKTSLTALAKRAGVSRGHLTKLTNDQMGLTPMEVVWRTRVRNAAKLLGETGLSLAEVAYQTGFSNAYHFSRRFKQQFGQAPRDWRRQNWRAK